jgi:nitroreductase/Pyruvate/2-oxoacid:ferredoxin oxidoreductase delta subunit
MELKQANLISSNMFQEVSSTMERVKIKVDLEKCTRCGLCAEVCPSSIIQVREQGPTLIWDKACIRCGHCVAICPQGAMDHTANPLTGQVDVSQLPNVDAATAERFLRSRRSIRSYKADAVPHRDILKVLEVARFAPSGGNSQGVSFLVLTDRVILKKITENVIEWLEEQIRQEVVWVKSYAGIVKIYRDTGYDIVLRGAPNLVLALYDSRNPIGRDNGRYALTYAELYAPSAGLGSCWAGFFEMAAFANYQPLLALLDLPAGQAIAGAIMMGVPKYRYQRLVDRNPLNAVIR